MSSTPTPTVAGVSRPAADPLVAGRQRHLADGARARLAPARGGLFASAGRRARERGAGVRVNALGHALPWPVETIAAG